MKKLRLWAILGLIVAVVVAIAVNRTPSSPLASVPAGTPPTPIADAEYVARLGDCVACHSVPDGKPFAGGLKMGTPLGVMDAGRVKRAIDIVGSAYSLKYPVTPDDIYAPGFVTN